MTLTKVSAEEIQEAEERAQKIRAEKEQCRKEQSAYFDSEIAKQKEQQKHIEKNYNPLIDVILGADDIKINGIPKIVQYPLSNAENAEARCMSIVFYKQDSMPSPIMLEIVEYVPAEWDTRIPISFGLYETN